MPLLQRQSYRGLTSSTSKAAWHSLLVSSMESFSFPTRHWRITRYRELHWGFWLHMSLAWTQSTHSGWAPGSGPVLVAPGPSLAKAKDKAEEPSQELDASSKWEQGDRGRVWNERGIRKCKLCGLFASQSAWVQTHIKTLISFFCYWVYSLHDATGLAHKKDWWCMTSTPNHPSATVKPSCFTVSCASTWLMDFMYHLLCIEWLICLRVCSL